ncbi:hypothetical protein BKA70DRAFT_1222288 [Coprinopsis sp. MPI-PUGE-AT-0042]|nr:hypothetical protein BKA70DRAFT_1222288 [Coprinopsis sp. MPI-PUGE-AT-0042]
MPFKLLSAALVDIPLSAAVTTAAAAPGILTLCQAPEPPGRTPESDFTPYCCDDGFGLGCACVEKKKDYCGASEVGACCTRRGFGEGLIQNQFMRGSCTQWMGVSFATLADLIINGNYRTSSSHSPTRGPCFVLDIETGLERYLLLGLACEGDDHVGLASVGKYQKAKRSIAMIIDLLSGYLELGIKT